jgi:molybdopterin converting factor small subunit
MLTISIRSFALLPNLPEPTGPDRRFELDVPPGTTLARLVDEVLAIPEGGVTLAAVNGRLGEFDYVLQAGDRIDLFAPLVGG